jgi:P-type Ca2+ transporter type 2C
MDVATPVTASPADTQNPQVSLTAHAISQLATDDVYRALASDPDGLTSEEAARRLAQLGPNNYRPIQRWRRWLGPLFVAVRPLLLPLWAAAALAYSVNEPEVALVLAVAALINTVSGIVQERKGERATAALRGGLPGYAHVVRDGKDVHILSSQVVPGDVLLLHSGEIIPADARVVDEHDLRTIDVALTGEGVATRKVAGAASGEDLLATELPNIVHAGGRVSSGTAHAVVYATGLRTAYGVITGQTDTAHEEPSPLVWVFARLGVVVIVVASVMAVLGSVLASQRGFDQRETMLLVVSLLAASVPTGLMPGITITLLEGWRRLGRHGVVTRRLSSVETLGATTVICADKTGTLTQNEMTVREVWTADGAVVVSGVGYKPTGGFSVEGKTLDQAAVQRRLGATLRAAAFTSDARLLPPDTMDPHWHILGDNVEAATLVAATKAGYNVAELLESVPQVVMLPPPDGVALEGRVIEERNGYVAYFKGAPSALLAHATMIATVDGERALNDSDRQAIRKTIRRYDRGAMRVIAFGRRPLPSAAALDVPHTLETARNMVFLGMMAVLDPPRQEVEEAIRTCHRAGIRTMMLTGDYTLRAESVARRCALVESARASTITGPDLAHMDDATLRERLREGDLVFARMTSEHKVRVVETLDAMGEVVLVTGGAANDVPALKAADIGIAMGQPSSAAAREAADAVLRQDNFATVVTAVAEGRAVEQRARRLVAINMGATVVKLAAFGWGLVLGWPLLLTVGQMLLIDVLAGFLPAVALGAGPPDPNIMRRQTRRNGRALIDRRIYRLGYTWFGLLGGLGAVGLAWIMMQVLGIGAGAGAFALDAPYGDQFTDENYLRVTTAYLVGGVAALIGAGLRLRASTRRYQLFRALLAAVLVATALILIAIARLPTFRPFVELTELPEWLWVAGAVVMVLAAAAEWGRQQADKPPA